MVRKYQFLLIMMSFLFLAGCDNDLLGVFNSTYLDERLSSRNNFILLKEEDRNPLFEENYSFIVMSDTHLEKGKTNGLENLKSAVEKNDNVKFVVISGDITQNGAEQDIDNFISIAESLGIPVYPVIGNHDIYFGNWSVWKRKIGSTSYRIETDTATLFILDSANSYFGKEQLDWLEKELVITKKNVFVFTHINLFAKKFKDVEQVSNNNERSRLVYLLKNKCKIMFMGHMHDRSFNKAGNVIYLGVESYIDYKSYCLVTVNGSEVSYKFLKL